MAPGRFLWRGEMPPLGITRPPSGCCACDGIATSVTVSPTLFHGEPFVAHTHWLSLCACPRRLHAHLTRSETPQRGLRILRHGGNASPEATSARHVRRVSQSPRPHPASR